MNISSVSSNISKAAGSSGLSSGGPDQLELLQKQKANLQKQLNNTEDENVKKQLEQQIQNIDTQILQMQEEKAQGQGAGGGQKPSGPPAGGMQGGKPPAGMAGTKGGSGKNTANGYGVDIKV